MTKAETTADSDEKIPIKTKGEKIKSPRGPGQLDRIQLARSEKERKMAAFGIVDGWPFCFLCCERLGREKRSERDMFTSSTTFWAELIAK